MNYSSLTINLLRLNHTIIAILHVQISYKCILNRQLSQTTVNVSYLASTIFGGQQFFNKLAWILITVFPIIPILIHICMRFSDVLELGEAAFHQKR